MTIAVDLGRKATKQTNKQNTNMRAWMGLSVSDFKPKIITFSDFFGLKFYNCMPKYNEDKKL